MTEDTTYTMELYPEPPTHTLTVTVVDAETVEPIEGATVSGVGNVHPTGFDMLFQGTTNEDGVALIEAYESGMRSTPTPRATSRRS